MHTHSHSHSCLSIGGINADNCEFFVANGASHVIVTSYVFRDGKIDFERLTTVRNLVGKEHLVRLCVLLGNA